MIEEENTEDQSANKATAVLRRINKTEKTVNETAVKIDGLFTTTSDKVRDINTYCGGTKKSADDALDEKVKATASATTAATKAGEATASATSAATQAGEATASATSAATQAGEATTDAATATTKASEATASATTAATKAVEATDSASTAATKAVEATDSASTAATKAVEATDSASTAATKAVEATDSAAKAVAKAVKATNSASTAATKEGEVADSATNAKRSEAASADSARNAKWSANEAANAHNLSTTAGLAGAFNDKAKGAIIRMAYASLFLVIALYALGYIGYLRFDEVKEVILPLINSESPKLLEAILAQILFFLIGAAAPIWLAWMSTKMISRYFQLSEDYAYKASLAAAYVGFKKQAEGLDPIFEERLFSAAIAQLDSNPLRFSENSSHPDSPLQDLLQQPFMIAAMKSSASFKDSFASWMNIRFKTNFRVEQLDLLDALSQQVPKNVTVVEDANEEIKNAEVTEDTSEEIKNT